MAQKAVKIKKQRRQGLSKRLELVKTQFLDLAMLMLKKDAIEFVQNFQDGIRKNNLKLAPLKPATIQQKKAKNYPAPNRPLFGLGTNGDKTYMKMLRIRKLKNGYRIYPSKAKHHESGLTLAHLLAIHEYGVTIVRQKKGGGEPIVIKIPPRPAFRKTVQRMANKKKKNATAELRSFLNDVISKGNSAWAERVRHQVEIGEKKIQEALEGN